ncbi:MAG: hypothetical protein IKT00_07425 [Prevotella sp.]|nr:hypothetical protein [Prevotella sp.]
MKRKSLIYTLALMALAIACGERPATEQDEADEISSLGAVKMYEAKGDSTIYGLACEGGGDSSLVFLPDKGGDPVSYSILSALKERRIFGMPSVGDKVALVLNPDNPKEVLFVINLEQLKGTWVYQVLPTVKQLGEGDEIKLSAQEQAAFDSLVQTLMIPVEYGFTLKRDFTAQSVGGPPRKRALDDESPVEYPRAKRYSEWHVHNGKLIFSYRSRPKDGKNDQRARELINDTAELILLEADTMVIKFADRLQGYSRKPDSLVTK